MVCILSKWKKLKEKFVSQSSPEVTNWLGGQYSDHICFYTYFFWIFEIHFQRYADDTQVYIYLKPNVNLLSLPAAFKPECPTSGNINKVLLNRWKSTCSKIHLFSISSHDSPLFISHKLKDLASKLDRIFSFDCVTPHLYPIFLYLSSKPWLPCTCQTFPILVPVPLSLSCVILSVAAPALQTLKLVLDFSCR